MKTARWEVSSGALVALINSGVFVYAHLYTITLAAGAGVLRFTDADLNITDGTDTWDSRGIRVDLQGSKTLAHWKRGFDVDSWLLTVLPRYVDEVTGAAFPDQINGTPWIQAARQGALDNADIQVDRAYFSAWPNPYQLVNTPVGILTIFAGSPGEIDVNDSMVSVTINDYRERLGIRMPRNTFQAGCRYTLYDNGCKLFPNDFVKRGAVIGGSTQKQILSVPLVPGGSGTFQLGKLIMRTGNNANFSRTISSWTAAAGGAFTLRNPFPFSVVPGDIFDAFPGCDKQAATCTAFGNLANFGGFPFIPQAETAT